MLGYKEHSTTRRLVVVHFILDKLNPNKSKHASQIYVHKYIDAGKYTTCIDTYIYACTHTCLHTITSFIIHTLYIL